MKNAVFITGPRGVGKTYVSKILEKEFNAERLDLGPLIREAYETSHSYVSFGDWLKNGEIKYGENFSDQIICEQIEKKIITAKNVILIGSRSIKGIKYLIEYFNIQEYTIAFIDTTEEQLKSNYIAREKVSITDEKFFEMLEGEKRMGLQDLREKAQSDYCNINYIINNNNTEEHINKLREIYNNRFKIKNIDRDDA